MSAPNLVNQPAPPIAKWHVRGFEDAFKSIERPPWVIDDLLLAESATLVSAQPHSVKSLSWLYAALEAVARKRVWGHFDASRVERVLFIETEDPAWLVEARIRGFAKGLGLDPSEPVLGFRYICPGPFDFVRDKKALQNILLAEKTSLAIISTLQNTLGGRKMSQQDEMAPVMDVVTHLARDVCPIVLLTHSPWDKRQRRAVGTVTQTANFLTTMHYEKLVNRKTGETFVQVRMDSKAGALSTDFHLKLAAEGDPRDPASVRALSYVGSGWPRGIGKQAVLAAIEDDPDATPREIAERAGVSERYVRGVMTGQRRIRKKGKGRPATLAELAEPPQ